MLGLCALILLSFVFWDNGAALARPDQRRTYQESPLSPVATPLPSSLTITDSLPVTTSSPLIKPIVAPTALATAATVTLVNRGQTSLLLVGAVLVGLLLVIGLVIGRRR